MAARTVKSQVVFRTAIIVGIVVLVNFIAIRLFARLDVTKQQLYSLSDASIRLMQSLDDKVTVRAYFTEDLPAPYNNTRRIVLDELNEYRAYAKGNLQFEFIDPSGEQAEQEAVQQGVVPAQVQVIKEDKFESKRGYMGLVFLYEDRKEVIPLVQNLSTLEYDISSTIKRLTSRSQKKIGFLTGQGEPGLEGLTRVQQHLSTQYEVVPVSLTGGMSIPTDIAALIVMAPTEKFSDADKYKLDQYIMRGGRVAFLLNKVDATLQARFGRAVELNLEDLLRAYGLHINEDLVRDAQCQNVTIMQQQMGFSIQSQVPFPLLPLVSNFDQNNVMVKDLRSVVLLFASSVDTSQLASRNLQGEILMRSSKQSGRMQKFYIIDPLANYTREDFGEKEIPLAAVVSGEFPSAFEGKPVPVDSMQPMAESATTPLTQSAPTRIVLVGDGDFVRDQYLSNPDNLTFFANMVDYLVDDAGLITIRSKNVTLPPLDQLSDGTKKMLKYGNLIVPPVIVIGYGLLRWRMRKARRRALEIR